MMILKSDEKNMVQKYIFFFFFLQYIHHFIQFKLHEKQNKKKRYIYIISFRTITTKG